MEQPTDQIFNEIQIPELLERQKLTEMLAQAVLGLVEQERDSLFQLAHFLKSPEIHQIIDQGNLTLGMIRPRADHNVRGLPDLEAAEEIRKAIKSPLNPAKIFSVIFDRIAVDDFYQGSPKERQLQSPPHFEGSSHLNRWEEFVELMTTGPTTILLLLSENGRAIQSWRDQVGHWNIEATNQPKTIRGQFGRDNYNNLVHGSDSQAAVKRELVIIADQLERMAR